MGYEGFYADHNNIVGLNICTLPHAIRENLVIYMTWIKDFWKNANVVKQ